MPQFSCTTIARGAKQLVVQEAFEITFISGLYFFCSFSMRSTYDAIPSTDHERTAQTTRCRTRSPSADTIPTINRENVRRVHTKPRTERGTEAGEEHARQKNTNVVHAHDEHGGVIRRGRDDDLLASASNVTRALLDVLEDTGGLADDISASNAPADLLGVTLSEDADLLAIDSQGGLVELDRARELAVGSVIAEEIGLHEEKNGIS